MTSGCCQTQVKLGQPGWRERYYGEKLEARTPEDVEDVRKDVVRFASSFGCHSADCLAHIEGSVEVLTFLVFAGPEIHRRTLLGHAILLSRSVFVAVVMSQKRFVVAHHACTSCLYI